MRPGQEGRLSLRQNFLRFIPLLDIHRVISRAAAKLSVGRPLFETAPLLPGCRGDARNAHQIVREQVLAPGGRCIASGCFCCLAHFVPLFYPHHGQIFSLICRASAQSLPRSETRQIRGGALFRQCEGKATFRPGGMVRQGGHDQHGQVGGEARGHGYAASWGSGSVGGSLAPSSMDGPAVSPGWSVMASKSTPSPSPSSAGGGVCPFFS